MKKVVLKGFKRNIDVLELLSEDEVKSIHEGTLEVLQETGVRIEHEEALNFLAEKGCEVNFKNNRVKIPPDLAEESIENCPSSFVFEGKDPEKSVEISEDTVHFAPFPGKQKVNIESWELEDPTRKEYYDAMTVLDALDNVSVIGAYTPWFGFKNVPSPLELLECQAAQLRNFSKPKISSGYSQGTDRYTIKISKETGIEIPTTLKTSPPLTYSSEAINTAFRFAEAELPISVMGGSVFGGTAPATIAGSSVTYNAEMLAGMTLIQLLRPSTKCMIGHFSSPQDMKSGHPAFGAVGVSLSQIVCNQIWREYDLPIWNVASGVSSSKKIDFQCAYEKSIMALIAALSGANLINLHGGVGREISFHPLQAILDDDIAGMIGRLLEGVKVNDETLALELIKEVGPIPGQYLNKSHTREWWKKEQFIPEVADRLSYPEWIKKGEKSHLDHASEKMKKILEEREPTPLTEEQEESLEKILDEAREYYREKGSITKEEWKKYKKDLQSKSYPYA